METMNYTNWPFIDLRQTLALHKWDPTPQESWRTMMLSDPPVTRVHLYIRWFRRPIYMGLPSGSTIRDFDHVNPEGLTLGEVYSTAFNQFADFTFRIDETFLKKANLWLWPRWSQWEMSREGVAHSEDGETSDETLIRINHELGLLI